ncbi:MAG: prepilin-type N-terminal cleavage/methylation domain-containing protein [Candidatus Firestonebacteria bacterium]|nr:prepilin-type N-terminal cleavage/methylation domain-containing protein [Candidatus Firestonebacteria bacterium]
MKSKTKYLKSVKNSLKAGFTLIELLAGLAIVVLVTASVYGAFSAGLSAWDKSFGESEVQQNARTALKIICRDLKSIVSAEPMVIKSISGAERKYFYFNGLENRLEMFCISRPVSLYWPENFPRRADFCRVTYYFEAASQEDERIVLKRKALWDKTVLPWKEEETEILEGITGLALAYYENGSWLTEWDTDKRKSGNSGFHGLLPRLVKVEVNATGGTNPYRMTSLETITGVVAYEK